MLRNYFLAAFRNFWRNKTFSLIHILGLSIGVSASLVIFLIVKHELSYDAFEADPHRIYRVVMDVRFDGQEAHGAAIPAPLPGAITREVSGVERTVPIMKFQGDGSVKVTVPSTDGSVPKSIRKQYEVVFTNEDYFHLLPIQWIAGDPKRSMGSPYSVVISESRANQYFPGLPADGIIGKQLTYNDHLQVSISGVVKDLDLPTDFTQKEWITYSTIAQTSMQKDFMMETWNDWMAYSSAWLKLDPANDKARVELQMNRILREHHKDAYKDASNYIELKLQPLSDVHFNGNFAGFDQRLAHAPTLYGLVAIAAFLLLLACINFINLSTAIASHRAREIGIRKTVGGTKRQLVVQFLTETFLICILATVISISIAPVLLQIFSDFIPPGVTVDLSAQPSGILFIVILIILVSLLSGLYPAFVLSRFRPAAVLKNQAFVGSPTRNAGLRKVLTVSQFSVAQFFVIAALMIGKQIHFSLNQDLGYRKDAIINFEVPREDAGNVDVLANQVRSLAAVENVSIGFLPPAMDGGAFGGVTYNNGKEVLRPNIQIRWGDPEYVRLYNIALVAGRNIRAGDNINEGLINETAASALGFDNPTNALLKELTNPNGTTTPIVGVMRDFHEGSFRQAIGPVFFRSSGPRRVVHVALHTEQRESWQATIGDIQKSFAALYPSADFNYSFFDETIAGFYKREQDTARLLNWAMTLSIVISCLGLLGLVMYISEARSKEIGIRKILGASIVSIISMLSREFVVLVLIAFAIAAPAAWYAIDQWLESFVFKTEISWWVFAAGGFSIVFIAFVTLCTQTLRAAASNPVNSLRNE